MNRLHDEGTLTPVRISLGTPKWLPWAAEVPYVAELAPYGMLKLPDDEFEPRYLARLERIGPERIERRLREVYDEYRRPLALCCFEADPAACHRRQFAHWWEQRTGRAVPELDPSYLDTAGATRGR